MASLVVGSGLGLAVSCQSGPFACAADEACAGLSGGQCEPSGYCSVPDDDCDSGRRYAPHSGTLSGQCTGTTGTATETTTTEEGTSTQGDATSSSDTSADGSGSTGTPEPPRVSCGGQLLVDEPFDALPLDSVQWDSYATVGVMLDAIDGELRLTATDATNAYSGVYTLQPLPPLGSVGVELLAGPPTDVTGEAFVVLADDVSSYGFSANGGMLHTYFHLVDVVDRTTVAHDATAHRWLRLRFDQLRPALYWETSSDGFDWTIVDEEHEFQDGFSFADSRLELGAGVWDGPVDADPLGSFGHAFVCEE